MAPQTSLSESPAHPDSRLLSLQEERNVARGDRGIENGMYYVGIYLKVIIIMCVDSAVKPPTCLDSVFRTESSTQLPARALLAATPNMPTSARSQSSGWSPSRYTQYRASAPTPGRVDRLLALHEAPRHAGLWT